MPDQPVELGIDQGVSFASADSSLFPQACSSWVISAGEVLPTATSRYKAYRIPEPVYPVCILFLGLGRASPRWIVKSSEPIGLG